MTDFELAKVKITFDAAATSKFLLHPTDLWVAVSDVLSKQHFIYKNLKIEVEHKNEQ